MRWRQTDLWAIAGAAALAVLLSLTAQATPLGAHSTGMSAPAPAAPAIDRAPGVKLMQSSFGWSGLGHLIGSRPVVNAVVRRLDDARQALCTAPPHYGPLHRRPPPIFS